MSRLADFFTTGEGKLYPLPGNAFVTGNIQGLEYSYSTSDTIGITAGICYDSLNITVLTLAADTAATIPSPVSNTAYNVFLTDAGDIQFDTDVDGATLLAGAVSQLRWIGLVLTDGSGNIYSFTFSNYKISFGISTGPTLFTPTTSYVEYSLSSILPISRVSHCSLGGDVAGLQLYLSYNGTDVCDYTSSNVCSSELDISSGSIWAKYNNATAQIKPGTIALRR